MALTSKLQNALSGWQTHARAIRNDEYVAQHRQIGVAESYARALGVGALLRLERLTGLNCFPVRAPRDGADYTMAQSDDY